MVVVMHYSSAPYPVSINRDDITAPSAGQLQYLRDKVRISCVQNSEAQLVGRGYFGDDNLGGTPGTGHHCHKQANRRAPVTMTVSPICRRDIRAA